MSLRLRLIVAFFLFSVVPLVAVTFYSYSSNERALQVAAQHEAEMLTGELTQRMQVVTNQISERVEHLMDMPVTTAAVTGTSGKTRTPAGRTVAARSADPAVPAAAAPAAPDAPAPATVSATIDPSTIEGQVAASLGEVAMLLNNVEVRGMGRGGGRGGFFQGPPGTAGNAPQPTPPAPGSDPNAAQRGFPRGVFPPDRPNAQGRGRPDAGREGAAAVTPADPLAPPAGREGDGRRGRRGFRPDGVRPDGLPAGIPIPPPSLPGTPTPAPATPSVTQDESDPSHMKLDLTQVRRELFREIAPDASFEQMTPEERARVGREVNQRLLGIVQGIQLGAVELQKKADAAQKQATAVSKRG